MSGTTSRSLPGHGLLSRPDGQQVGARLPGFGHQRSKRALFPAHIRIGKQEVLASGLFGELMTLRSASCPASPAAAATGQDAQARVAASRCAGNFGAAIGGLVIEQENFQVRILLRQQRTDGFTNRCGFVPHRQQDADAQRLRRQSNARTQTGKGERVQDGRERKHQQRRKGKQQQGRHDGEWGMQNGECRMMKRRMMNGE